MPNEIEIERNALEGTGKIIVTKVTQAGLLSVQNGLIKIGDKWLWATGLFQDSSLIALIRRILGQTTTTKFRDFLLRFDLTLQDLFDDQPEDTTKYIQGICEELKNSISSSENVHLHTLRNLKEWLDSLKPGPADHLRETLQDTIAIMENLLGTNTKPSHSIDG